MFSIKLQWISNKFNYIIELAFLIEFIRKMSEKVINFLSLFSIKLQWISAKNVRKAEVNHYKNGEMNTDTLQFQLFVMCANKVISYKPFYKLPIGQINEYFQVVKFFTIHEVEIIITNII